MSETGFQAGPGSGEPGRGAQLGAWAAVLAELPLFAGVSTRHLRGVARLATIQRFAPGTEIMRMGESGATAYVLLHGSCEILRGPGRRRIEVGQGAMIGEMCLLDGQPRSATVVARSEVTMLCLGRIAFQSLLRREPVLMVRLLQTLAQRLRDAEGDRAAP